MATDRDRLKATLDDLHQQLGKVEQLDPAERSQLAATLDDIRAALVATSPNKGSAATSDSLIERLRETARNFEESHPALAGAIGSLIDTLGRMGI